VHRQYLNSARGSSLSVVVKKILALISIEREFLSVDVKNEVVQIFSDRELIWERDTKRRCAAELFICFSLIKELHLRLILLNNVLTWQFVYRSEKHKRQQCIKLHVCTISYTVCNRKNIQLYLLSCLTSAIFGGPMWCVFACRNAIFFMHCIPRNVCVRPHQVTIMSGPLMPCLKTICMVLFNDVYLHLIFYPITSMAVSFQCVILHIFIFPPLCNTPV